MTNDGSIRARKFASGLTRLPLSPLTANLLVRAIMLREQRILATHR